MQFIHILHSAAAGLLYNMDKLYSVRTCLLPEHSEWYKYITLIVIDRFES